MSEQFDIEWHLVRAISNLDAESAHCSLLIRNHPPECRQLGYCVISSAKRDAKKALELIRKNKGKQ